MDQDSFTFPDDDTGDALRTMRSGGDELNEARDIDFTVVFATEPNAKRFAEHFARLGYKVSVKDSNCKPSQPWDVLVVNAMVPTHAGITEFEGQLQEIASELGGDNDGWGCFRITSAKLIN